MDKLTMENFWGHPFIKELQPNGKLVMVFAICCMESNHPIILEDLALLTGVEMSAAEDYLDIARKKGLLEAQTVDSVV